MMREINIKKHPWLTGAAVMALAVVLAAGCKHQQPAQQTAAPTDQQVAGDIQAKIQGESALAGQNIQVSVQNGVATLSGTVSDDASRALAGNDSGTVNGVKTVVNNLTVEPSQLAAAPSAASPVPEKRAARHERERHEQAEAAPPPHMAPQQHQAPQQASAPPPPPPPPPVPPRPVVKQITLPAGTVVPVRITEGLDSKTTQTDDVFHASLAEDLMSNGVVAIPRGAAVLGRVIEAREAAHFKGNSLLTIELTQLLARGQKITLFTDTYSKAGAGRGKNTAEKAGGGAALGALIGALAGGGKGAAIGAIAGGGAGTGINAATRGQQVQIPSETVLNFRLQSPITLTVTIPPAGSGSPQNDQYGDPQLQHR